MDDDAELQRLRAKRLAELQRSLEQKAAPATPAPEGEADGTVREVSDATFDDFVRRNRVAFIDFWAPWCGPCRLVAPVVAQLAQEYRGKVAFAKMDTDQNPQTALRYGVQSIPFLVTFKDGEAVDGVVGAQPKGALRAAIEPYV